MSSSLLLQQCSACLVHLTWIVFMMGGRWPYSWCLVGCCRQDLLFLNKPDLICLHTVKWFQVLRCNINNSSHHNLFQVLLFYTNNSVPLHTVK